MAITIQLVFTKQELETLIDALCHYLKSCKDDSSKIVRVKQLIDYIVGKIPIQDLIKLDKNKVSFKFEKIHEHYQPNKKAVLYRLKLSLNELVEISKIIECIDDDKVLKIEDNVAGKTIVVKKQKDIFEHLYISDLKNGVTLFKDVQDFVNYIQHNLEKASDIITCEKVLENLSKILD